MRFWALSPLPPLTIAAVTSTRLMGITKAQLAAQKLVPEEEETPLDKSCENESIPVAGVAPCDFTVTSEPDGWMLPEFDDSSWTAATIHSSSAVDPKGGYDDITWDSAAEFIWGPDLETNNTLLCRVTVDTP